MPKASPFPGYDPFVRQYWHGFHNKFASCIADAINDCLDGTLVATIDERIVIETDDWADPRIEYRPDVAVVERFERVLPVASGQTGIALMEEETFRLITSEEKQVWIDIIEPRSKGRVVTSIEIVSPSNKRSGAGRNAYLDKQRNVALAGASLIEMDFINGLKPLTFAARHGFVQTTDAPYHISVTWGYKPGVVTVHPVRLSAPLGGLRIPLREIDTPIVIDLQVAFDNAFSSGRFHFLVNYAVDWADLIPLPDRAWAIAQLESFTPPAAPQL